MTPALAVALAPRVTLDGGPLPTALAGTLTALRVVRPLRTTAWARLELAVDDSARILDPGTGVSAVKVGQKLAVAGRPTDAARVVQVFDGTVTRVETVRGERGGTRIVVTAQDATAGLATESARTFVEQRPAEMLKTLLAGSGLHLAESGMPTQKIPYMLQAGSALRFVDDVAQRTGSDWALDGRTLHVWPAGDPRPHTEHVTLRADEVDLTEVSQESGGPTHAVVTSWDPDSGEKVTGESKAAAVPGVDVAERVVIDSVSQPLTPDEATVLARARLAGTGPVAGRVRTRTLVPLVPGGRLTVTSTWWPQAAEYVREVTTTWDRAGWTTDVVTGSRARTTLADLGGRGGPGTDRGAAAYTHDGVVVGVVEQLGARDHKDPRARGRVRVTFPFLGGTVTSDWARVATLGAGPSRGLLVMPEIGDEVLVAFEGSDVRRPVVVAGLFSKKNAAPGKDPFAANKVARRGLTSRTGSLVELVDGDNPKDDHVLLALAKDKGRLRLGGDAADLTVPDGIPVTIAAGSTRIHVADDGSVTIEGASITLKAQQKLDLEAQQINLKARTTLKVEGVEVGIKAQAKAALESGGIAQVKGSMVQIN